MSLDLNTNFEAATRLATEKRASATSRITAHAYIANSNISPEFLAVYCAEKKQWQIPGGKAEEGETALDAIVRELKEEIGLTPKNLEALYTEHKEAVPGHSEVLHVTFGIVAPGFQPQLDKRELSKSRWTPLNRDHWPRPYIPAIDRALSSTPRKAAIATWLISSNNIVHIPQPAISMPVLAHDRNFVFA